MLMTTSVTPAKTLAGTAPAPLFDAWSGIAGLYRDAMEASAQQLFVSSANIIQQHTMRAFMDAASACADALAKNAVVVQQKSMLRFAEANQKATNMMGQATLNAWTGSMRPIK